MIVHICVNSYQGDDWFINTEVPQLRKFHQDSGFMYKVVNLLNIMETTEKVFFLGREPQDLVNIETSLKKPYGDKLSITYSTPVCLEIMNQKCIKSHCTRAGIS